MSSTSGSGMFSTGDGLKAWNASYDTSSSSNSPFVFSTGGDSKQEIGDTPFVPEKGFYQPSTDETWEAYQGLISLVQAYSRSNLPCVVQCGVADEVLSVLKSNNIITPQAKKSEIEKMLDPIPDFLFDELVSIANCITDYYVATPANTDDRIILFAPEKDFYQPKSDDTCTAYKMLLDLVNNQLGSPLPQVVQCVLAHEILVILKNREIQDASKKQMMESCLNSMSDDTFDVFLFTAERITDGGIQFDVERNDYINHQRQSTKWEEPADVVDSSTDGDAEEVVKEVEVEFDLAGEVNTSSPSGFKVEYSSEEEIMNLDYVKVHGPDKEDEDGWVKIDYNEDGI